MVDGMVKTMSCLPPIKMGMVNIPPIYGDWGGMVYGVLTALWGSVEMTKVLVGPCFGIALARNVLAWEISHVGRSGQSPWCLSCLCCQDSLESQLSSFDVYSSENISWKIYIYPWKISMIHHSIYPWFISIIYPLISQRYRGNKIMIYPSKIIHDTSHKNIPHWSIF